MKTIRLMILSVILCFPFGMKAQQEYTMDFIMVNIAGGKTDSTYLHFARAPKKLAANSRKAGMEYTERFVVDSIKGRMMEMYNDNGDKQAVIKPSKTENNQPAEFPLTDVLHLLSTPVSSKGEYKLMNEVKLIQGVECQKMIVIIEGKEVGEGWLAKGYALSFGTGNGAMLTPDGMALEITTRFEDNLFKWKCTEIKFGTLDSSEFSFDVPDDYELVKRLN